MAQPCQDKWPPWCADTRREWGTPTPNKSGASCLWQQTSEVKGTWATKVTGQTNRPTSNTLHVFLNGLEMTDTPHWELFTWDGLCVTFYNLTAALKKKMKEDKKRPFLSLFKSSHRSLSWTAKSRKWKDQCSLSLDRHILSFWFK